MHNYNNVIKKEIEWDCFFDNYYEKYWKWNSYFEAVKKYGEQAYNECFGYEPLLKSRWK